MKQRNQHNETNRGGSRSSIAVSRKIVCEDEACIGKEANSKDSSSTDRAKVDKPSGKSSGTSMSIGGKEACSNDACIGKK